MEESQPQPPDKPADKPPGQSHGLEIAGAASIIGAIGLIAAKRLYSRRPDKANPVEPDTPEPSDNL